MVTRYTVLYEVRSIDCQSECAICSHFFLLKIVSEFLGVQISH